MRHIVSRTTRRQPFIQCAFLVANTVVAIVVVGGFAYANPPYPSIMSSTMLKKCTDICVYDLNEIIGLLTERQHKKLSTPSNVVGNKCLRVSVNE